MPLCAMTYNDYLREMRLREGIQSFANGRNREGIAWPEDGSIPKYSILYNASIDTIMVQPSAVHRDFGGIYFDSFSDCAEAIELFKDELRWYFTEYNVRKEEQND